MLGNLFEAKKKAEEIKNRLETISVTGEVDNGAVVVTCNGNRKVLDIKINPSVFNVRDREEVEELITVAVNRALEQADQLMAAEMKTIMPNIPGLGNLGF
ncbi:YbaB/EbfC family nucleoid-associated protein [Solitalea canadensis]|uniref:Nucleoid-associated protein Solca_1979 n=1 Tax=Solitalea canadensis (strain ATCC 29591 / DSM 3403 / JCM 21819 / LMG 8368 / NBRC 15130 / NCIMB 12057 / USAM 9D) TaxID=929556 RepID=H8KU54_SOLCM|nr:YbaB/EbfC family nucleoid-associated protein [Solitalea canadensis]AFD07034.1 DNA-binding protein, YbaB/EbfC family [Solitalea canadensis DSM 3403]